MTNRILHVSIVALAATLGLGDRHVAAVAQTQTPPSRRSQRVHMPEVRIASPDGTVVMAFLPNAERLTYTISLGNTVVLDPSTIAMELDGYDLSAGVVFRGLETSQGQESYPWYGAHATATSNYKATRIFLTHDLSFTEYVLEVRAFDDGIAFRHVIAGDVASSRVPNELSAFVPPAGSTVWYAGLADGHYEAPYQQKDVASVGPGEWAGPPVTFRLPRNAGYASITEANLVNYSGMGLESDGRRGWVIGLGHRQPLNYPFELRYGRQEGRRLGRAASVAGPIITPWRVIMIGRDLNTLVNSTIVPNLVPAPDPALFPEGIRTSWIKPGRAVWRYLDGGPTGVEGMKEFSRMASELGFEHHVIEGVWAKWTMDERKSVVEHARQRGVGIWFWRHSNQLRTPQARREFFAMLHELGVVGAKIDFFDHDAKEVVDLYESILRDAAEQQIMVVFHGSNKPTGRERAWPNELVRESVRGMESSSLMERARHQTILPFTRYLAGGADYTTMLFSERRRDSTVAHQIASLAVFASPLLTVAANPQSILASPAADVIKSIPPVWDETSVLAGSEIGEMAIFARRRGDIWFLAVMCGAEPRIIKVPLSFLGPGRYTASLVHDDVPAQSVRVDSATHSREDTITLELGRGGGFVGRFTALRH